MKETHFIEITESAAMALLGKEYQTPTNTIDSELAHCVEYIIHGVKMRVLHNFTSNVIQYYIQDINA